MGKFEANKSLDIIRINQVNIGEEHHVLFYLKYN